MTQTLIKYCKKSSFKYCIGYNDDGVTRPLYIKHPQMIVYVKCFGSNKTMSFKARDNKLLKELTEIWKRISGLMNVTFDSERKDKNKRDMEIK